MTIDEAVYLLMTCERKETDPGPYLTGIGTDIHWYKDGEHVADGWISAEDKSVSVQVGTDEYVEFEGKEAERLAKVGLRG